MNKNSILLSMCTAWGRILCTAWGASSAKNCLTKGHIQVFPDVSRYILAYFQHWSPEPLYCTSFVVNDNCHLNIHKDVHNLPETQNYIIGLGPHQGGELWIES